MTRAELVSLSGQIANGILSADNSILSKAIDRTLHRQIADTAINIAHDMLEKIDAQYRYR